nr:RNA-directed DNA polymerase, eukaryota [Tanacetum cinerariifolium]
MDIEENLISSFAQKRLCIKTKQADNILEKFKVIFKGNVYMARAKELFAWTPIFLDHKESEYISNDESLHGEKISFTPKVSRQENDHRGVDLNTETDKVNSPPVHTKVMNNSQEVHENVTSNEESAFNYSHNAHNGGLILEVLDDMIRNLDSGNVFDEILLKRMELTRKLHDINQMEARDYVHKSKIKWAIEGDKNSKFFHVADMDRSVSRDEIRVAVWNCGENKSPGLDRATSDGLFKGVMVRDSMSRKLAWADIVQKLRSRLSKWKVKTLSIGGRLTLLKSVLVASPLYNMSIYRVPKGVLKEMEAVRCNFSNGVDPVGKKITWVSWDKVLASKKNGGLGVSSFHALNRALLLKWVWRFISQEGSLWYRVIQALYGASFELHPVNLSSIWCSILREMQVLISKGFDFVSHCKKHVGDGHNTRFWYDSWVFDQPLRVRFPHLFALETDKESTVASKLGSSLVDASF